MTAPADLARGAREQICDWADQLALDILADIAGRRHSDQMKLVAFRLRQVRLQGEVEGMRKVVDLASGRAR